MKINLNNDIQIDLPTLIDTRLLIQANSGGGKSWVIRRILEQSHGKVQHIILDLEGEFSTLREKFDYILAATDGDVSVDLKTASLFAKKLLELNVSAIIDLYDLNHQDRKEYVRRFLTGMMNAPKDLRHPCLVVIDEAHVFCPEKGQSVASESVIDLMTRGRKRGYSGILATQRLSKLHKDAAAEANNKLIGRTGLDVDMKRASEELGFSTKEDYRSLRSLEAGEFFVFGPAVSKEVVKIQVGEVETTHPKAGSRISAGTTVPPTQKIKSVLSQLGDLPQAVKQEEDTIASLQAQIRELKRTNQQQDPQRIAITQTIKKQVEQEVAARTSGLRKEAQDWREYAQQLLGGLHSIGMTAKHFHNMTPPDKIVSIVAPVKEINVDDPKYSERDKTETVKPYDSKTPAMLKEIIGSPVNTGAGPYEHTFTTQKPLVGGAIRMLNVLAQRYPMTFTKSQLATLSKLSPRSGTYSTYISALKSRGFIEITGDVVNVTDSGLAASGEAAKAEPQTTEQTIEMWRGNLVGGSRKIFDFLVEIYPRKADKESIGNATGYSHTSGTFGTYLSMLKSNGLIEVQDGNIKLSDNLFT